jgi:L-lactate dehydrogenase complex protein LldG
MSAEETEQLLAEFREKAEPLGVAIHRVSSQTEAAQVVENWLCGEGITSIVVAEELSERAPEFLAALSQAGMSSDCPTSPEEMRDAPAGASLALLAIAETGSTLLSESSLRDRSVGMLSLAHFIVCPTEALVASLDDAAPVLRRLALAPGGAFSTLVTGPSRTADIERVLTVGVQGPGKVMVLFVDDV